MKLIFSLFSLLTLEVLADSTLVITGNLEGSARLFKDMSTKAALYSKRVGDDKFVFVSPVSWDLAEGDNYFDADINFDPLNLRSKALLRNALKQALKDLPPGENLKIFLSDHGYEPTDEKVPLTSGLMLGKVRFSHKDFADIIKEVVPKERKVLLIGSYCFSGGLHSISFENDNICSSAVTDFRTPARAEEFTGPIKIADPTYGASFWDASLRMLAKEKKRPALFQAHVEAVLGDTPLNDWRGDLSSFAFVDHVLGEGPYTVQGMIGGFWSWSKHVPYSQIWDINPYLKRFNLPEISCMNPGDDIHQFIDKVKDFTDVLDKLPLDLSKFPPELQDFFKFQDDQWRNEREELLKMLKGQAETFKGALAWEQIAKMAEEGKLGDAKDKFLDPAMTQDMKLQANKFKITLSRYLARLHLLYRAEQLTRFYEKATDKQKKKFEALLKCEQTPL